MEPFIDESESDEEMVDEQAILPSELNAGRLGLGAEDEDDDDDGPPLVVDDDDDDDEGGEGGEAEEDQSEEELYDQSDDDTEEERPNVFLNVGQAVSLEDMVEVFEDQVDLEDDYEDDPNEENLRSSMMNLVGALRRDPIAHSYLPLQQSIQPTSRRNIISLSSGQYIFSGDRDVDFGLGGVMMREGRDVPQELEQMLLELLADSDTTRTPTRTTPTPSRGRPFDNIFGNSLFGNLSGLGITPIRGASNVIPPVTINNSSQMDTSGDVTTPVQNNNNNNTSSSSSTVEPQTELLTPTTPILPQIPIVEEPPVITPVASSSSSSNDAVPSEPQATSSTETAPTSPAFATPTNIEPTTPVVTEVSNIVETTPVVEPVAQPPQQPRQQNFPIDPAFFTEMPDFIRQELLEMHYDQLIDTSSSNEETAISQDFLDALPNEIRNEVLRFEREHRTRRPPTVRPTATATVTTTNASTTETTTATTATVINPTTPPPPPPQTTTTTSSNADVNPVEFLSTLSPELRRTVLLEADDDLISMLTPDLAREAAELRLRAHQRIRAQQHYIDRRQEGALRENAFSKAIKKQIIETEKDEEKETIFKEKELILLLRLYLLTRSFGSNQQPFFTKICLAHKETRKILVDILLEVILNYNTPLNEIPERIKILCDVPQKEGVFMKEENTIRPIVINCTLYLISALCKSEVGPYILPIITGIDFTESEGVRGEKFVKLLSLLQPKMFTSNFFLGFIQLVDSCAKFVSESVKVLNEENNKLKKEITTLEEQINKLPGKAAEQPESTEEGASSSTTEQTEYTEKSKLLAETTEKYKASQTKYETLISYVTSLYNENVIRNVISLIPNVDVQEKALKMVSSILDNIACSLPIRKTILVELSTKSREEAKKVKESLNKITIFKSNSSLVPFDSEKLAFCRIVKTYSSILKRYKKERETEGPFVDHSLLSEYSLDYVWEALDKFLSSIPMERDEVDEKTRALGSLKKKRTNNSYNELFPFIEAFFAFHSGFSEDKEEKNSTLLSSMEEHTPTSAKGFGEKSIIENFLEKHREILNAQIESNPSLLTSTLSLLMKYPKFVDFKNKLVWFKAKLKEESKKAGGVAPMTVRRSQIFTDSYFHINTLLPEECKGKLHIKFEGEEGYDAGGVKREWFSTLSRAMLYPGYALFAQCADRTTYHPNPSSYINQEHLSYFKFTGRIIAMAIYNEQPLDCHFTRSFYKHILGIPITYHDIESIDPNYYRNLKWMLTNSIENVLYHTFTHEFDEFGTTKEIELKPNGKNIPVTDENKAEYVRLVTELKMTKSIEKQLEYFLKAFYDIIPRKLIQIFNEQELELLISGLPDIDIQDLKNNTIYGHGYTKDSVHIKWFWNVVESFGKDDKALLLQFVTGTSKVPLGGFSQLIGANGENQLFCIQKSNVGPQRLPTAHTCFNQLDLPEYDTEDILRERLLVALRFGSEGFGFV